MKSSVRTVFVLAAAILAAAALGVAPAGSARKLEPDKPSLANLGVPGGPIDEGVVRPARVHRYLDSSSRAYPTADGMTIYVSFSDRYVPDPEVAQSYVDLLGWFTHGSEMDGLQVFIYTPDEVTNVCGPGADACYESDQMVISGTQVPGRDPVEQVMAHEYGHHIAEHRLNTPWPAVQWGPKRWATQMDVCLNTREGLLFPGDEGAHYPLNPGEGWAEAYRMLIEKKAGWPDIGWYVVDDFFKPGAYELNLVKLDVTKPWRGPSRYVKRGRLSKNGVRRFKGSIYDGPMSASVKGPRGTTVSLRANGRVLRRPSRRVRFLNCGRESVTVIVRSKFGGKYRLRITADDANG